MDHFTIKSKKVGFFVITHDISSSFLFCRIKIRKYISSNIIMNAAMEKFLLLSKKSFIDLTIYKRNKLAFLACNKASKFTFEYFQNIYFILYHRTIFGMSTWSTRNTSQKYTPDLLYLYSECDQFKLKVFFKQISNMFAFIYIFVS